MLESPAIEPAQTDQPDVGIDVGLHHLLALSDGTVIENPRWLRANQGALRVAQRRQARRKKGGTNWRKAGRSVAGLHEKVANSRREFWHQTTRRIINTYGNIVIEDLPLAFMVRNGNLSLSAHDAALGMFRQMLTYKAEEAGTQVTAVKPARTSQVCSGCGSVVVKSLSVRTHHCPDCGLTLDRDVNAARNILTLGRSVWAITWPVAVCVAQEAPPL
jgi:putative transposase